MDIYIDRIEKELVNNFEKTNNLRIIYTKINSLTNSYIFRSYQVNYNNTPIFIFNVKLLYDKFQTIISKGKDEFIIDDNDSTSIFVDSCTNYVTQILNDYEKLKNNFYIDRDYTYKDVIFIKKPFSKTKFSLTINMDKTYTLKLGINTQVKYRSLDEVINSIDLEDMKRTKWRNIFRAIHLF